jgi:E3 ubiquitin-protein ligase synoviolin
MALTIGAKYVINLVDLRRAVRMGGHDAPPWEEKSMWVFYVDLVSGKLDAITPW